MIFIYFLFISNFLKNVQGGIVNPQALRYDPVPYFSSKVQSNKDASGARIISRDPFIISLELPDKDPKDLSQTKRKKIAKKRNRLRREIQGEDELLDRTKRCSGTDFLAQKKRDLQPIEKKPLKNLKPSKHRKNFRKESKLLHVPENASSTGYQCPIPLVDDQTLDDLIDDIKKIKEKLQKFLAHISSHEISEEVQEPRFDGSRNGIDAPEIEPIEFINTVAEDIQTLQKKIKYISDLINKSDEETAQNIDKPSKLADAPALDLLELSEENPYIYELLKEPENGKINKTNDQILIRDKIKYLQSILKPAEIKSRKKRDAVTGRKASSRRKARCAGNDTPVVSKSQNRERYKLKKWEDDLKLKRSQSKCPCGGQNGECTACKCSKCQKCRNKQSDIDILLEASEEAQNYLESTFLENYPEENVLNWEKKSRSPVLDPFVEDLTLYRQRAKQILKNAQEILKRLKETEEQWAPKSGGEYLESTKWGDIDGDEGKYGNNEVEDLVLELIYKVGKRLQEVREELASSEEIEESEDYMEAEETSNQEEDVKDEKLQSSHPDSSRKFAKAPRESAEHHGSGRKLKKSKDHGKHVKSPNRKHQEEDVKEISQNSEELEGNDPNLQKSRDRHSKQRPSGKSLLEEAVKSLLGSKEMSGNDSKKSRDKNTKQGKSSSRKDETTGESENLEGDHQNSMKSRDRHLKISNGKSQEVLGRSQEVEEQQDSDSNFKKSREAHAKEAKSSSRKALEEETLSTSEKSEELPERKMLKELLNQTKKEVKSPNRKSQEEGVFDESEELQENHHNLKKSRAQMEESSSTSQESEEHEDNNSNLKKSSDRHTRPGKSTTANLLQKVTVPTWQKSDELPESDILKELINQGKKSVKTPNRKSQEEKILAASNESRVSQESHSNLKKSRAQGKEKPAALQESVEHQGNDSNLKKSRDRHSKPMKSSSATPLEEESIANPQKSEELPESDILKELINQGKKSVKTPNRKSQEEKILAASNESRVPKESHPNLKKSRAQGKEKPAAPEESVEHQGNDSNLKKSRDRHSKPMKSSTAEEESIANPQKSEELPESKILKELINQTKKQVKSPDVESQDKKFLETSHESEEQENHPNLKKSRNRHTKPLKSSTGNPLEDETVENQQKSEELESDILEKLIDQTKKHVKGSSKKPKVKELAEILQKSEEESGSNLKQTKKAKSYSLEDSFESDDTSSKPKTTNLSELLKLPGTDVMRDHRDKRPNVRSGTTTTVSPSEESSESIDDNKNLEASNLGLNSTDSVEKLMDDFEAGKMDEEDMKAIKKLDDEKINNLIDQIDEAEADEEEEEDCDYVEPACDCTDNSEVDKYEIMKSFLLWIKEMHMDNVLSN